MAEIWRQKETVIVIEVAQDQAMSTNCFRRKI
jgi:hypothetical protein